MADQPTESAFGPLVGGSLRVLTWNLWWRFGPWEARLPAILDTVAALDPDIACFQEVWVDTTTGGTGGADGADGADGAADSLAARIADRLGGFHHHGAHRFDADGVLFANAVVSRWPIERTAFLDLPSAGGTEELRTCMRADVATPHGDVQVFCTHLNWRFDESHVRQAQVREICRFVADAPPRTFPPVLCGDFNATPDSDELRQLTGRAAVPVPPLVFHDAWEVAGAPGDPGFTWCNDNEFAVLDLEPNRRIDYVLVGWPKAGGRGHVTSCEVVGTKPVAGITPSDHYGVLATLRC